LWWAQDGWFWSKPVLDFWLQGLSFSLLGVEFWPDRMLSGIALGHTPHPEWAARLPVFLMTALASYAFYKAVGRWVHARAGLLSALVLATTPYWFLISHQSITDMPYVAALVACLSFFLLGLASDPEAKSEPRRLRLGQTELVFSGAHALLFVVLICALPQICYLISRNLTLDFASGVLDLHFDVFMAGSGGGNCGLPGNVTCLRVGPLHRFWQPVLLALLWLFLLLVLVKRGVAEVRLRPLFYLCAWLCLSLSAMAKGAPGLVLPLFVIVVFLVATRRWKELLELRPLGLVLIFAVVVLPWYVQVVARHGSAFLERLLLHDMYKRAFDHVHDTNDGVDVSFRYYLWQLGYGLFPWSGVAAAALIDWARKQPGSDETSQKATSQQLCAFCALWFIATFALFTLSGTKFHHYILPAVPALAALSGIFLHELCESSAPTPHDWRYLTGLCLATSAALVGVTLCKGGPIDGLVRQVGDDGWTAPIAGGLLLLGAGTIAFFTLRQTPRTELSSTEPSGFDSGMLAVIAALGTGLVARDFLTPHGERLPGQVLLMQLFSYQYKRPWPESLEFSGALFAFGLCASAFCLGLCHQRTRAHAAMALSALATLWAAWGIDLYLVRAAPHWGQRETIAAYYRARRSADPPLVAYQMNWKGENFYTGNRVAAFVKSGEPFQKWIEVQRRRGIRTLFFTTEPSRFGALKRELGSFQSFEVLTLPSLNNKFALAKVDL
jgi:4-amino-4-deoxy-L-arabinose transferase-like glycosyltransferase